MDGAKNEPPDMAADELLSADAGSVAFVAARQAVDRGALNRYLKEQGATSAKEMQAAEARFRTLPLLASPALHTLALTALAEARGPVVDGATRFPATVWMGGATDTWGGRAFLGNVADFVRVLHERAKAVAPKRTGWVVTPTTCSDGRRINTSTTAMHALNLDCDGGAEWDKLLSVLVLFQIAHIMYQSGGWTSATPKWHVLLPLSRPFNTSTPEGIASWKSIYNHARVVIGALAGLPGDGFDPTVETPSIPIFITERRQESDPPRIIVWAPGHSLDLMALTLALPPVEENEIKSAPLRPATVVALDDDRLEEIVTALCEPMSRYQESRRELYLALAGVLCDRGVGDETVQIIEEISLRIPGLQDRHNEHVHCARTTVNKWESGGGYTRIDVLNERWPDVAEAVDDVLPNGDESFRLAALALMEQQHAPLPVPTDVSIVEVPDAGDDAPEDWQIPVAVDHATLKKFAKVLRTRKRSWRKSGSTKDGIHWTLLDRMLRKKPLAKPTSGDSVTQLTVKESINSLAGLLAFKFPQNTPFDAVRELVRPALETMLEKGESPEPWLTQFKKSYARSLASKLELEAERAAELSQRSEFARAYALRGGVL